MAVAPMSVSASPAGRTEGKNEGKKEGRKDGRTDERKEERTNGRKARRKDRRAGGRQNDESTSHIRCAQCGQSVSWSCTLKVSQFCKALVDFPKVTLTFQ